MVPGTGAQLASDWQATLEALPRAARDAAAAFERTASATIGASLARRPCVLHQSTVDVITLVREWNRNLLRLHYCTMPQRL